MSDLTKTSHEVVLDIILFIFIFIQFI